MKHSYCAYMHGVVQERGYIVLRVFASRMTHPCHVFGSCVGHMLAMHGNYEENSYVCEVRTFLPDNMCFSDSFRILKPNLKRRRMHIPLA